MKLVINQEYVEELCTRYGKSDKTVGAYAISNKFFNFIPKAYIILADPDQITIIQHGSFSGEKKDIQVYHSNDLVKLKSKWAFLGKTVIIKPINGPTIKVKVQTVIRGLSQTQKDFLEAIEKIQIG